MRNSWRQLSELLPALCAAAPFLDCSASNSRTMGSALTAPSSAMVVAPAPNKASDAAPLPDASTSVSPAAAAGPFAIETTRPFQAWINYDFDWAPGAGAPIPESPEERQAPPEEFRIYVPVELYDLQTTVLATDGYTVGLIRDGAFEQDGLYSRRREFDDRIIVGLAGQWPKRAWQLQRVIDNQKQKTWYELLRWTGDIWTPQQKLNSDTVLLGSDGAGNAVLVQTQSQGGKQSTTLRRIDGQVPLATTGSGNCATRLASPKELLLNRRGDVLVLGKDCEQPQQDMLELWEKNRTRGQILPLERHAVQATWLDERGRVWASVANNTSGGVPSSTVMQFDGAKFSEIVRVGGSISSIAVAPDDKLWVVVQLPNQSKRLQHWVNNDNWETVRLPSDAGNPNWVRTMGGRLWVSTKHALLSFETPAFAWDWEKVTFVEPVRHGSKRKLIPGLCLGPGQGGVMVVVVGKGPRIETERWGKLLEQERSIPCQKCVSAKLRNPSGLFPQRVPFLAREGATYFFGFVTTSRYTANSLSRGYAQLVHPEDYCASPISFSYRLILKLLNQKPLEELQRLEQQRRQNELRGKHGPFWYGPPPK